jgi:hypothetical protein
LVTGVLPFHLENGEYMEVTVNDVTYSSKTGAVNVNLANDGWSVQIPAANALKAGTYDVVALIKGADGSVLSHDDTKNELIVQQGNSNSNNNSHNNNHNDDYCHSGGWWWSVDPLFSVPTNPTHPAPKGNTPYVAAAASADIYGSSASTSSDPITGSDTFTDSGTGGLTVLARSSSDTINMSSSGHDTLLYTLLDATNATGGNGADRVNGFTTGAFGASSKADRIDLADLLTGYTPKTADGPAHFVKGVATIDAGDSITQYLSVTHNGGNATINIDRDGAGGQFTATALVTLNGVNTDLATLLANHQIVVDHG